MNIATMPLAVAVEALKAVEPFSSPKDIAPILATVMTDNGVVVATDRYGVGRYKNPNIETDGPVLLSPDMVAWVTKINPRTLPLKSNNAYLVTFTEQDETWVDATLSEKESGKVVRMEAFERMRGNFPPVERLMPETLPTDEASLGALSVGQVERLTKSLKQFPSESCVILRQMPTEPVAPKKAPVYGVVHGTGFDFLIQPVEVVR